MTAQERVDAYAIHHAARTWKDAEDWRDVTLLLESRLADVEQKLERERQEHMETKRQLAELRRQTAVLGETSSRR
jgi:hypothetical protein